MEVFTLTITQLANMFIFLIIGFIMRKKEIGGEGVSKTLSALLVNVFLPAMFILNFRDNFTVKNISENLYMLLAGTLVLLISIIPAKIFSRLLARDNLQKDVYMYSLLIPNLGYMGYPLMQAVFGNEMQFNMMMFAIPYQLTIYTYGMYILNPNRDLSMKRLLNPILIALFVGMILGLTQIPVPKFLLNTMDSAQGCMAPSAMILTGFVLGKTDFKPLFKDARLFFAALLRGFIIPIVFLICMMLLKVPSVYIIVSTVLLSMPMGLNSIVFPEAYGGDSLTGAKSAFVSNLISIVSIPVMFTILGFICK